MTDPEPTARLSRVPDEVPRDQELRSLELLLGGGAQEVLTRAVAEEGGVVQEARPRFVAYRPGRRIVVRYWADVRWRDGSSSQTTIVATERRSGPPPGALEVEAAGTTLGVWRWPGDPQLPGLKAAANADYVRALLDAYGAPPGRIFLRTMSYWPGRRAVIEVTIPPRGLKFDPARGRVEKKPGTLLMFIKVVRQGRAQPLYELHRTLGGALPIASCPGGSDEHGLLVLEALAGHTLGQTLTRAPAYAPAPGEVLQLVHRLGRFQLALDPRNTTDEKVAGHLELLRAVLPGEAATLDRLAEAYGEGAPQPLTTVHGDFHESQILIDRGAISGLLDVDDAGPGQLVDDLALLVGRVWALGHFAQGNRAAIRRYAERLLDAFSEEVDEAELRRRIAGALIGRATMPFRGQDPGWATEASLRLRLAEEWLAQHAGERATA
ncbi:MAG: phosphotransferase [Actinobacteria bacterium]|nr:phosphotransferase [Actinomycetota bacterium]